MYLFAIRGALQATHSYFLPSPLKFRKMTFNPKAHSHCRLLHARTSSRKRRWKEGKSRVERKADNKVTDNNMNALWLERVDKVVLIPLFFPLLPQAKVSRWERGREGGGVEKERQATRSYPLAVSHLSMPLKWTLLRSIKGREEGRKWKSLKRKKRKNA